MRVESTFVEVEEIGVDRLAIDGGKPVRDTYLAFGTPCIGEEEIAEVVATLRSGWIGTGPKAHEFEARFAEYVGSKEAISVSSCTAALHLALLVHGVGPGDEVITTPLTFTATANVIVHCGAKPVFVDIETDTWNINIDLLAKAITPKTKAIIAVHFGGLPVDLDALRKVAGPVPIIEDCAHAVAGRYKGQMIGGSGNLCCFSFYANKNLTTGEGGMVTLNESKTADRLRVLRLHGMDRDAWKRYSDKAKLRSIVIEAGYKYNLTDMQASLGIHQLRKIERFTKERESIAAALDRHVDTLPSVSRQYRPADIETDRHGLHLYCLVLDLERFSKSRDEVVMALRTENIGVGIHYGALHQELFYQNLLHHAPGSFPVAERIGNSIFTLPTFPGMTAKDISEVCAGLDKVLNAYRI